MAKKEKSMKTFILSPKMAETFVIHIVTWSEHGLPVSMALLSLCWRPSEAQSSSWLLLVFSEFRSNSTVLCSLRAEKHRHLSGQPLDAALYSGIADILDAVFTCSVPILAPSVPWGRHKTKI